jgi:hypothetical protein
MNVITYRLVRDAERKPVLGNYVRYQSQAVRAAIAALLTPEEREEYKEFLE